MIARTLVLAAASALLLAASASAAKPDSFSGTSVNKEIYLYGDIEPRSDKGKVTFAVKSAAVKNFKLKAQQVMCGATTAEIPVTVAKIDGLPKSWLSRRVRRLRVGSPPALAGPL